MATRQLSASDFKDVLAEEFARRCHRNPRYSIRSFASFLEMDFSTLAKILNGQRKLGPKSVRKIGQRLGISSARIEKYLSPINNTQTETYTQIAEADYDFIADWHHYALLELMRLPDFKNDPQWISRTLDVPITKVRLAINRLVKVGMLAIDATGQWHDLTGQRSTNITPFDSTSAQKKLQHQILTKAKEALEFIPRSHRDQTSMTMAVDRDLLPEARILIKKFRRDLADLLSRSGTVNDVFHLSVGLYPVTNLSLQPPQNKEFPL